MKKTALILLLLTMAISALAQEEPKSSNSFLQRIDSRMYKRQHKLVVDTSYIYIPEQRWTLKTSSNITWNTLGIKHQIENVGFSTNLQSDPTYSQGISVAWRWLELGFSINPAWFIPSLKNSDQTYSISFNGNKFGMSATFRVANSYKGTLLSLPDSTSVTIPKGDITADISGDFDAWYVFNGNKFSYSAPFTMMQIQKRSAGSAILGLSVRNGFSVFEGISYNNKEKMSLMTNILALGGGYAHNFITPHQWLIHVSIIGNLSVLSYNVLQTSTETTRMKNTYPDWVGTFQFSVLHWTQRWFYGFNFSLRGAVYGTMDNLEFTNARTEGHLVVGCRL
ncbi:MAG: DUF4421 domain-containing protein [Bacteroidales bacterium]|nr:DUF4421 domain-containing protein [Bacteroidales bacterium]